MMDWHTLIAYTAVAQWSFIFVITVLIDIVWAKWAMHTSAGNPFLAGLYAIGIVLGGAISIIWYLDNRWLLIPICAGSFVGTYVAVKHGKKAS